MIAIWCCLAVWTWGAVLLGAAHCAKAGIWTNQVLHAMQLPSLPLVTSVEQQTYYATPEGDAGGGTWSVRH